MFVFWKIWRALFSFYLRFEIRLLALLPIVFESKMKESKVYSVEITLTKWSNQEKAAYFRSWFIFILKRNVVDEVSMLLKSFSFVHKFRLNYISRESVRTTYQKMQKIAEIILTATKICYFAQFGIFDVVIGSRESKINCILLSCNVRASEWIHTL